MEAIFDIPPWDELIPGTLGLIFMKLSLPERLNVIPRVCKSWNNSVKGPYCWKEIYINYEWSSSYESHQIESLVRMLINKSSRSLRKLIVHELQTEEIFTFIVENAGGNIQNLGLPRCNVNDFGVKKITEKISMITILDLSYCMKITLNAIETIGKNCKYLEAFYRKMHPSDTLTKPIDNSESLEIASTMPKLKHLEISYNCINNDGVRKIVSLCHNLELLDLRGCWDIKIDEMNVNQTFQNIRILGPQVPDYYETGDSSDYSDFGFDNIYEFFLGLMRLSIGFMKKRILMVDWSLSL